MAVRVALDRDAVDGRAARVAEAEEAGHLVEGLAGGVVDRGAEHLVLAVALHVHEQRVAARHEQHHERQLEVGLLEQRRVEVGLEVVDGDERHVPGQRQRLGRGHADEQRADQAGAVGGGHRVDVAVPVAAEVRSDRPASTKAWATTGTSRSTWARLAISGTTPP